MKFSICSWIFGEMPLDEVITFAANTGYDEVEVGASVKQHDWKSVKATAKKHKIRLRGINADASFLRPETNLVHNDEQLRKHAIDYFKQQIDIGEFLEAEYFVLAPGAPGHVIPFDDKDWQRGINSIQELAEYGEEKGVQIVIEPLNRYENCLVYNAQSAQKFLSEINHKNVKTMLDTFHMNIEEADFIQAFELLQNDLETIHVADSNRKGLGHGHITFEEVVTGIKNASYSKTITLECLVQNQHPFQATANKDLDILFTYAKESLEFLHNHF